MTENIQIKVLDLGYMTFYKKELVQTEQEDAIIFSPALAILIKHPEAGYILYDTGNDAAWESSYSEAMKATYPITKLITIEEALQKEGLTVHDIDQLVLSHLHFDHAGGMKYFRNTKAGNRTLVSAAELKEVAKLMETEEGQISGAYIGALFWNLSGVMYQAIEADEVEIAEGVTLFVQKCHTAGLLGMRVELRERTIIFTGDTVYTKEAYEKELPPGGSINKTNDEFFSNIKRLKELQRAYQAEVFFGHDYEQARTWQKRGWIQ